MDDPMTIIRRHVSAELDQKLLLKTVSEISETIGSYQHAHGSDELLTLSWLGSDDGIIAQASLHGVFLTEEYLNKTARYQIAGYCYLRGIPVFTDDDVMDMIEAELPSCGTVSIN
jgi:hypothetical protein